MQAGISLDSVSKTYDNGVDAVRDVSLDIEPGEFVVLVGPSGCGKSTLLRLIAGLESLSSGTVMIGDRDVTELSPRVRDIAMVFQNYALYPQMSVKQNLAFGLRMRKMPKEERDKRVAEVAETLGLTDLLRRRPAHLSGGQRQRVAMGRAMVREPSAFLMDEPLSNLDAKLRVTMRTELSRLHDRLGVTTVYVTHDQVEAMTLGERVAVLRDGVLQQCDRPQRLFDYPANLFVAAFIGSPTMNLVEADVADGSLRFAGYEVPLNGRSPRPGPVILGIRPDDLLVEDEADGTGGADACSITVKLSVVEELGAESMVIFPIDAAAVTAEAVSAARDDRDEDTRLLMDDDRALWTARVPGRRTLGAGETIRFVLDVRHLHFFEPTTGESLLPS